MTHVFLFFFFSSAAKREAMTGLRLVGATAFRSFRNVWMLEELGVTYEHIVAGPRSPEADAGSPFGKIPSLRDGEFQMYESAAINTYLGDKFRGREGAADLVPEPGSHVRGRYEQAIMCMMSELDAQGLWIHRKHEALAHIFGACPIAVEHAKTHTSRTFAILAAQLRANGGPYLLGSDFSAADILFVHCCNWAEAIGWGQAWTTALREQDADMQLLKDYLKQCRSRAAYQRTNAKKLSESAGT